MGGYGSLSKKRLCKSTDLLWIARIDLDGKPVAGVENDTRQLQAVGKLLHKRPKPNSLDNAFQQNSGTRKDLLPLDEATTYAHSSL